jgi:amino acid adenylation domain-containing protein
MSVNSLENPSFSNLSYHENLRSLTTRYPDDIALCFRGETPQKLSYRELDILSNYAAQKLHDAGCCEGMMIPLYLERGLDCVIWAIGAMKIGCAAVPITEDTPLSRVEFIVKDTGAPLVVAHPLLAKSLSAHPCLIVEPENYDRAFSFTDFTLPEVGQGAPMMILYTSGTTGQPKGVKITHRNVIALTQAHNTLNSLSRGTRVCAHAAVSFVAFLIGAYAPLMAGARVYILEEASRKSVVSIHRYLVRNKIENVFLTTRLAEEYMRAFDNPHLRRLTTGGEALREFIPRSYELYNLYGPTEATAYVSAFHVKEQLDDFPIGFETSGNKVLILNDKNAECEPGEIGEICISGNQVSSGYVNSSEREALVFGDNPLCNVASDDEEFGRIYHTGDLGMRNKEGLLFFRGRRDQQLKIRGYRIEPREIEVTLMRHPEVEGSIIVGRSTQNGDTYLTAYYTRTAKKSNEELFTEELRAFSKEHLNPQMVPQYFIELEFFPLNRNGKIDKSMLPTPNII